MPNAEPGQLGQLIDHNLELQDRLDRLNEQIALMAFGGLLLAVCLTLMGWRLWHQ